MLESADGLTTYRYIDAERLPETIYTALLFHSNSKTKNAWYLDEDPNTKRYLPLSRCYTFVYKSLSNGHLGDLHVYKEVQSESLHELEKEKKRSAECELAAQRVIAACVMDCQHELALEMNKYWSKN